MLKEIVVNCFQNLCKFASETTALKEAVEQFKF